MKVTYRLRDWLFSRQRYWGEPFPIVWDEKGNARALSADALPVALPEMSDYKPSGSTEPPLSKAKEWVNVRIAVQPDGSAKIVKDGGAPAKRETNTMPQWAGSCWYYLRFTDACNDSAAYSPDAEKYWMNVDLYVGGAEHAVLHLLYSRFWHKVLFDHGLVHTNEPFQRLFNQGLITAFAYKDDTGRLLPNDEIEIRGENDFVVKATGRPATQIIAKMSKALKNVVNPDDVINEYGADTLRLYEMFMGPLDGSKPWNPRDVPGVFRFLRDCWRMLIEDDESKSNAGAVRTNLLPSASELIGDHSETLERDLHKTIKGVTNDFERMAFNTAISKLMVFKNKVLEDPTTLTRSQAKRFVLLLAPLAPHIAEELWSRLRHNHTLAYEAWPSFDEKLTQDSTKELAVQINGKVKARITVAANAGDEDVKKTALEAVKGEMAGKTPAKVIVVPGRLVNIVVK
jgi:leucyl-tRNA synthetase